MSYYTVLGDMVEKCLTEYSEQTTNMLFLVKLRGIYINYRNTSFRVQSNVVDLTHKWNLVELSNAY